MNSSASEIATLLKQAADQGRVVVLTSPTTAVATSLLLSCCRRFKLRPSEAKVLVILLEQGQASYEAFQNNPASKTRSVHVVVHHLRRRLKPYNVKISTIWGAGFCLADGDRDKIRKLLDEHKPAGGT